MLFALVPKEWKEIYLRYAWSIDMDAERPVLPFLIPRITNEKHIAHGLKTCRTAGIVARATALLLRARWFYL